MGVEGQWIGNLSPGYYGPQISIMLVAFDAWPLICLKGDKVRMRHGGWWGSSEQLDAIHGQMHIGKQTDSV